MNLNHWISEYLKAQTAALQSVPPLAIEGIVRLLAEAVANDRQVFVFGNGGCGAIASHFACDLGKGASNALGLRFRVRSLNDNMPWITAIANDHGYEDIFWRQLEGHARPGDLAFALSVSGKSPNIVSAVKWCAAHQLRTVALVGAGEGSVAQLADTVISMPEKHFGRVEDVYMTICHVISYAFVEGIVSRADLTAGSGAKSQNGA